MMQQNLSYPNRDVMNMVDTLFYNLETLNLKLS